MFATDPKLVLGENHSRRLDSAQLRLAELCAVRHHGARERHCNGLAGRNVRRAANNCARSIVSAIDAADAESVGVWVLLGAQNLADDKVIG